MATVNKNKTKKVEVIDDLDFDEEIVENEEDYVFIQVDPRTLSKPKQEEPKQEEPKQEEPKQEEPKEEELELSKEEQIKKSIQERMLAYKKRNNIDKQKV